MSIPIHPSLVHIPLGVSLVVPLVALALAYAFFKQKLPRGAWVLLLGLQAFAGLGAIAALKSGDQEEDRVEQRVPKAAIHAHEEAAEQFASGLGLVLVASIGVFFLKTPRRLAYGAAGIALLSAGVAGLGLRAGHQGGELVYAHGAASAPSAPAGERTSHALLDD